MTATPQTAGPLQPPLRGAGPELLIPQHAIDRDRAAWLALRTTGITGTDVASLLGLSTHAGPYSLYHAKLDGVETEDRPVLRRGRLLEREIDDLLVDEHPWLLPRDAGLYARAGVSWMMATIDRWVIDSEAATALSLEQFREQRAINDLTALKPAEYKTWATTDGWSDTGGDGNIPGAMPVAVRCQAIWNMTVAGADEIMVVVLFMQTWRIRVYTITAADPGVRRDLDVMIAEAQRFRQRLADHDEPPVDDLPATTETLRKLHPSLVDESVRVPAALWTRYHRARAAAARAESRVKRAQNELRQRMGPAARAHILVDAAGTPLPWSATTGKMITVTSRSIGDNPVKAHTRHVDKLTPGKVQP